MAPPSSETAAEAPAAAHPTARRGAAQSEAHARTESAALELFIAQGYASTTVEDIVAQAGIARRTFFRYFTHKREVLFWGHELLADTHAAAVAAAPADSSPLELAGAALAAVADIHAGRREIIRRRQLVVAATPELQERQLLKNRQLSARLAGALEGRGVAALDAEVTAAAAISAYSIAFRRWAEGESENLRATLADVLAALARIDAPATAPPGGQ